MIMYPNTGLYNVSFHGRLEVDLATCHSLLTARKEVLGVFNAFDPAEIKLTAVIFREADGMIRESERWEIFENLLLEKKIFEMEKTQ